MSRWQPDARRRLREAALKLYGERGYDSTTVAEIARHAGLTERTFFRHFADKREVLFSGEVDEILLAALADAPDGSAPMAAVVSAIEAVGPYLDERRDTVGLRQAVIAANDSLLEREQIKFWRLSQAMADLLRSRGLVDPAARLTAEAGVLVLKNAFDAWVADDGKERFAAHVRAAFEGLRAATG